MDSNSLVQWICVGVIFLIVAGWVVRYIAGLVRWSRGRANGLGDCCGGGKSSSKKDCCQADKKTQPGAPCAGCGKDCPLARDWEQRRGE